jgi:hypothetical protein
MWEHAYTGHDEVYVHVCKGGDQIGTWNYKIFQVGTYMIWSSTCLLGT